jgi:ribosomal protein S18 acetylase RimI-like enzyme
MGFNSHKFSIIELSEGAPLPYNILLLADPSKRMIDEYLPTSDVFIAILNRETIGVIVLFPLTTEKAEIKAIAVKPDFQGQGIGRLMIEFVLKIAVEKNLRSVCIGTANSSIGPLHLYQKLGFEITEVKKDFFTDNYQEPIFENGIQAKDMLVLTKAL